MTEEAKRLVELLRDEDNYNVLDYIDEAADLIESLTAQLEQVEMERDGLNILLAQAQAMLETRTKERDAAVADLKEELRNQSVISLCENCRRKPEGDYIPNDCMDCVNGCNWQWRGAEVTNDA